MKTLLICLVISLVFCLGGIGYCSEPWDEDKIRDAEGTCYNAVDGASFRGKGCVVTKVDRQPSWSIRNGIGKFIYDTKCENTRGSVYYNLTVECTIRDADSQWIYSISSH
jgi:hypothetical protein